MRVGVVRSHRNHIRVMVRSYLSRLPSPHSFDSAINSINRHRTIMYTPEVGHAPHIEEIVDSGSDWQNQEVPAPSEPMPVDPDLLNMAIAQIVIDVFVSKTLVSGLSSLPALRVTYELTPILGAPLVTPSRKAPQA